MAGAARRKPDDFDWPGRCDGDAGCRLARHHNTGSRPNGPGHYQCLPRGLYREPRRADDLAELHYRMARWLSEQHRMQLPGSARLPAAEAAVTTAKSKQPIWPTFALRATVDILCQTSARWLAIRRMEAPPVRQPFALRWRRRLRRNVRNRDKRDSRQEGKV